MALKFTNFILTFQIVVKMYGSYKYFPVVLQLAIQIYGDFMTLLKTN